eukprot:SAG31_NODE_2986_length_4818_cov_2.020555_1_plen_853_part_10
MISNEAAHTGALPRVPGQGPGEDTDAREAGMSLSQFTSLMQHIDATGTAKKRRVPYVTGLALFGIFCFVFQKNSEHSLIDTLASLYVRRTKATRTARSSDRRHKGRADPAASKFTYRFSKSMKRINGIGLQERQAMIKKQIHDLEELLDETKGSRFANNGITRKAFLKGLQHLRLEAYDSSLQRPHWKSLFPKFDHDHDDELSMNDFTQAMLEGAKLPQSWMRFIEILFHCIDKDGGGTVSGHECQVLLEMRYEEDINTFFRNYKHKAQLQLQHSQAVSRSNAVAQLMSDSDADSEDDTDEAGVRSDNDEIDESVESSQMQSASPGRHKLESSLNALEILHLPGDNAVRGPEPLRIDDPQSAEHPGHIPETSALIQGRNGATVTSPADDENESQCVTWAAVLSRANELSAAESKICVSEPNEALNQAPQILELSRAILHVDSSNQRLCFAKFNGQPIYFKTITGQDETGQHAQMLATVLAALEFEQHKAYGRSQSTEEVADFDTVEILRLCLKITLSEGWGTDVFVELSKRKLHLGLALLWIEGNAEIFITEHDDNQHGICIPLIENCADNWVLNGNVQVKIRRHDTPVVFAQVANFGIHLDMLDISETVVYLPQVQELTARAEEQGCYGIRLLARHCQLSSDHILEFSHLPLISLDISENTGISEAAIEQFLSTQMAKNFPSTQLHGATMLAFTKHGNIKYREFDQFYNSMQHGTAVGFCELVGQSCDWSDGHIGWLSQTTISLYLLDVRHNERISKPCVDRLRKSTKGSDSKFSSAHMKTFQLRADFFAWSDLLLELDDTIDRQMLRKKQLDLIEVRKINLTYDAIEGRLTVILDDKSDLEFHYAENEPPH